MTESQGTKVKEFCKAYGHDRGRLMDILEAIQAEFGCVSDEAMNLIAEVLSIPRVEVESTVSFYSFLSTEPKGRVVIRLSNDVVDRMRGFDHVAEVFCEELGIEMGQTTPDGQITLETTACIGMCDQAPAALVNDVVVTELSSDKAREIVKDLRTYMEPKRLVHKHGDGNNAHALVRSMVHNNVQMPGTVIFSPINRGQAIAKALVMSPNEVIREVKTSRLRGRGGAGFPTGMKWEFTRAVPDPEKYVLCNADEGEPGTFKDRVILTERPDRVFAGMTIAGYAIGASQGILYLRGEYAYLKPYLEDVLQKRREDGLLGKGIGSNGQTDAGGALDRHAVKRTFDFDIRIQMGAGAYVCGEETALISSCEGMRGDPKNRPPFPAQKGYLGHPTVVNNVETLCCVTKILEEGAGTFSEYGSKQSGGTKLLSISGDCMRPGIYEVPFGVTLREVLEQAGGDEAIAVQVGGASGQMIGPDQFGRIICFDDLATGGAIVVFGPDRNILEIVHAYMEFFVEESCGYCTPCRVGNVLLLELLERVMSGRGDQSDIEQMEQIGATMKATSRCGLGQTSFNPIITSLKNIRPFYDVLIKEDPDGFKRSFDLKEAVRHTERIIGRESVHA